MISRACGNPDCMLQPGEWSDLGLMCVKQVPEKRFNGRMLPESGL